MQKRILMLVLAFSLVTLGACSNSQSEKKDGPFAEIGTARDGSEVSIESASIKLFNDTIDGNYQLISTEELKGMIDAKEDIIIVDTMPAENFEKNHIPGAINAELPKEGVEKASEEQKKAFLDAIGTDKSKKIVVYCGFVKCRRSHVAAFLASEAGFENVYRHPAGIVGWSDAGYEMEGK